MEYIEITHDKEPIRLFKSNFLEFFTHIHPAVVVIIWLPIAVYTFLVQILNPSGPTPSVYIPLGFLAGIVIWTFTEYTLHRFLFHYKPKTPAQEKIFFLFHGVHHAQPQCKTRLVMPPIVSVPLATLFYFLFHFLIGIGFNSPYLVAPFFSGFITGYLIYDLTHYATHHFPMRKGIMKYLKRYHLQHHYKTPNMRYGVSSPFWDIIFKTKPE